MNELEYICAFFNNTFYKIIINDVSVGVLRTYSNDKGGVDVYLFNGAGWATLFSFQYSYQWDSSQRDVLTVIEAILDAPTPPVPLTPPGTPTDLWQCVRDEESI